jgi:hypothetical protein
MTAETPDETGVRASAVRFRVDEAFKGTRVGEAVTVLAINKSNCCGALPEFSEGSQFLLFTLFTSSAQNVPVVGPCDPVIPIAEAGDHLTYLRNLLAHNVATEVYGEVYVWENFWSGKSSQPMPSVRITFTSENGTFDTISDALGRFRRNLRSGNYEVGADVPGYMDRSGAMSFTLAPESCAEVSVSLEYNGTIEGRAVDDHRNPATGAAVSLLDATTNDEVSLAWTGADGEFSLNGIAPGDYVLGLNVGPLPDVNRPYAATFYPSEPRREFAQKIHLEPGQQIRLADIITSTDRCAIVVRVLDAAGRPVSGATLAAQVVDRDYFFLLDDPGVVKDGRATVPAWGRGRIQIRANLEIDGDWLQSEPKWIQVCPKKPVTLKLNHRYEDEEKVPN